MRERGGREAERGRERRERGGERWKMREREGEGSTSREGCRHGLTGIG